MNTTEIAAALALGPNTKPSNLTARCLRLHVAGGAELLSAKEWANGVANSARTAARDPRRAAHTGEIEARRALAEEAVAKLLSIEAALLSALEHSKGLPAGTLTAYLRGGAPGQ